MQFPFLSFLIFAVIFVNGWTDAPNSIATPVITGVLPFRQAAIFAAVCEFLGVMVMSLLCPTVAKTTFYIADFGSNPFIALTALQSALLTIVLWSVFAWFLGIPTSESHALVAALTGASIAIHGNLHGVSAKAWLRILIGLLLSTLLGKALGHFTARFIHLRFLGNAGIRLGQILSSGLMAFFHGAQDGQKFLALLLLANALTNGNETHIFYILPLPAILCATVMSCGVLLGGKRIIQTLSRGMGPTDACHIFIADLAAGLCLLLASVAGLPVSTTHTKISVLLGTGISSDSSEHSGVIRFRILAVWLLTFPVCALLAWILTRLALG